MNTLKNSLHIFFIFYAVIILFIPVFYQCKTQLEMFFLIGLLVMTTIAIFVTKPSN